MSVKLFTPTKSKEWYALTAIIQQAIDLRETIDRLGEGEADDKKYERLDIAWNKYKEYRNE